MNFGNPWLLLLLIPLGLALLRAWRKRYPSIRMPSARPFKAAGGGRFTVKRFVPFCLYAAACLLVALALARPRQGQEEMLQRAEGIDIMIAIDLSGSMAAMDVPGAIRTEQQLRAALNSGALKSRLAIAKEEIRKFIDARPNDRIGLIAFAQLPYVVCPPTLDHGQLAANIERLEPGLIGDATGVAGPIASAVQRLKDSESKRRIVVLFTDGSNNVNAQATPRQAAKLADTFNVAVYTVGIGTPRAYVMQRDLFGSMNAIALNQEFDEKLLQDVASSSGGRYYKAADAEEMSKAMAEIDKLEKTSVEQPRIVDWREWGPSLCAIAAGLLLLGLAMEGAVLLSIP